MIRACTEALRAFVTEESRRYPPAGYGGAGSVFCTDPDVLPPLSIRFPTATPAAGNGDYRQQIQLVCATGMCVCVRPRVRVNMC